MAGWYTVSNICSPVSDFQYAPQSESKQDMTKIIQNWYTLIHNITFYNDAMGWNNDLHHLNLNG